MDEAQVDAEKLRQVSKLQRSIELPTRDDIDLYSRECVCVCGCAESKLIMRPIVR